MQLSMQESFQTDQTETSIDVRWLFFDLSKHVRRNVLSWTVCDIFLKFMAFLGDISLCLFY